MDSWMKWILWDFLVKNINILIQQSHTNPWDFVILSQICVYRHFCMSCFLLILFLCQMLQKSLITYDFLSFAFFFLPNSCFLIDNFFSSICWLFVWIIFFFFCSFRWIFPTIHLFLGKNPLLFFFLFTICYFF